MTDPVAAPLRLADEYAHQHMDAALFGHNEWHVDKGPEVRSALESALRAALAEERRNALEEAAKLLRSMRHPDTPLESCGWIAASALVRALIDKKE